MRSTLRPGLIASGALHVGGLLAIYLAAPRPRAVEPPPAPAAVTDTLLPAPEPESPRLPPLVEVEVMALAGRAGGTGPRPVRPHARHPRAIAPAPAPPAAPAPAVVAVSAAAPAPDVAPALETAPAPEAAPAAPPEAATVVGGGDGHGVAGDGPGAGSGGDGAGSIALRSREELHARVIGDRGAQDEPHDGPPFISNKEATALRTRDFFPRLSEEAWPYRRPYMVSLDVCVAEDGHVTEATLRSSASDKLDAIVQAAVAGWRYRPRVVGGKPAPFCHGVVIKYERW